jgi:hypothetical protein
MCIYIKWGPVEIQTPTQQKLMDRGMTVPPPVLSPSNILPPPSSDCAFITARKNSCAFQKYYFSVLLH